MGNIRVLDDHLANQIAAGEVVERPSSVVKELVENAIDAGGQAVDVTIEDGGVKLIRVVDNGSGMDAEDLQTAFLRHATSKIRTSRDLFAIRSLGFRGEALPSIAAVSRMECITSTGENGIAHRIAIEGGAVQAFEETVGAQGTDFRVMDLFYNTPARLKYMKTVQTELGHITDFMYRLALSRPDIAFRLHHNGSQLLDTVGGGNLMNAIASVYGTATAKRMVSIESQTPDYTIEGYIARPDITRSNRSGITVVVNGRVIRNIGAAQAIIAGYHTLLPVHRFPLAVLHIRMEPALVDVNVHPAKLEVRFSKEAELMESITAAIRSVFEKHSLIPSGMPQIRERMPVKPQAVQEELQLYRAPSQAPSQAPNQERTLSPSEASLLLNSLAPAPLVRTQTPTANPTASPTTTPSPSSASTPKPVRELTEEPAQPVQQLPPSPSTSEEPEELPEPIQETIEAPSAPRFPKLYPIGQLHGTYIVAQNEVGLYLVDQHAAHERINYEYYFDRFGRTSGASQLTMLSHVLEFTPSEAQTISSRLPLLEAVGVYLEPFGGNTFKVRSYPDWFPQGQETELIEEMSQWVLSEKSPDVAKIREASAILCSCKASIKANQAQSIYALEKLLDRLSQCRNPFTCPHGRPIVVHFSTRDLEKMFKRVM